MASPPPMQIDENTIYHVTIATNRGDIVLELDPKLAPVTVNNFVSQARSAHRSRPKSPSARAANSRA